MEEVGGERQARNSFRGDDDAGGVRVRPGRTEVGIRSGKDVRLLRVTRTQVNGGREAGAGRTLGLDQVGRLEASREGASQSHVHDRTVNVADLRNGGAGRALVLLEPNRAVDVEGVNAGDLHVRSDHRDRQFRVTRVNVAAHLDVGHRHRSDEVYRAVVEPQVLFAPLATDGDAQRTGRQRHREGGELAVHHRQGAQLVADVRAEDGRLRVDGVVHGERVQRRIEGAVDLRVRAGGGKHRPVRVEGRRRRRAARGVAAGERLFEQIRADEAEVLEVDFVLAVVEAELVVVVLDDLTLEARHDPVEIRVVAEHAGIAQEAIGHDQSTGRHGDAIHRGRARGDGGQRRADGRVERIVRRPDRDHHVLRSVRRTVRRHGLWREQALAVVLRVEEVAENREVFAEDIPLDAAVRVGPVLVQRDADLISQHLLVVVDAAPGVRSDRKLCRRETGRRPAGSGGDCHRGNRTGSRRVGEAVDRQHFAGREVRDAPGVRLRRARGQVVAGAADADLAAHVGGHIAVITAVDAALIGAPGPVALRLQHRVLFLVLSRHDDAGLVVAEAGHGAVALVVNVALLREAVAAVDGEPFEVVVEQHVDHAADRVRAVDGRSAVLEDLDALDQRGREEVDVLEQGAAGSQGGGIRDAPAVEQHQRGQTVNADFGAAVRGARRNAGVARAKVAAAREGGFRLLQGHLRIVRAGAADRRLVQRRDGGCADLFRRRNEGAGHDDAFGLRGFARGSPRVPGARGLGVSRPHGGQ